MTRFAAITHKGKSVFVVDMSEAQTDEIVSELAAAEKKIALSPPKSALILTIASGTNYNTTSANAMKEFSAKITPYVRASAVVGADGMRWVLLQAVNKLTGRNIKPFNNREDALDWLVSES